VPKGPQGQKRKADVIGNAVLAIATDQGAYVLDNLASAVLPWTTTHYIGVAHQVGGQSEWASLGASVGDDRSIVTANIIPQ